MHTISAFARQLNDGSTLNNLNSNVLPSIYAPVQEAIGRPTLLQVSADQTQLAKHTQNVIRRLEGGEHFT